MSNPHRLMYSKANQAFVFTFGDQLLRIGDNSMFYRNKADAVRAALRAGLVVDSKGFVTAVDSEQLNGHEELEGADWALVRASGMDDHVLSTHRTKEAAEKAMRKFGGTPDSVDQRGMRVVNVGQDSSSEMIEVMGKRTIRPRSGGMRGLDEVSARSRQGTRVRFNPSPGSLVLYTHHPEPGEEGSVTTMPGFGKRTYLPGPGGGLLYVKWDQSGTIGVSPKDVDKVSGNPFSKRGGLKVGAGRPGQKFTHGDVEITTTLHPVIGSDLEGSGLGEWEGKFKSLNYGVMPSEAEFVKRTEGHYPYPMELVDRDEIQVVTEAKLLDMDGVEEFYAAHKFGIRVLNAEALYNFLKTLVEVHDRGEGPYNDAAGNLASSILYTLGYEWV